MRTRKRLFILSCVVLLGVAGFMVLKGAVFSGKVDPYRLIPGNSVFVFETTEPVRSWNQLVSQSVWKGLSEIPALKNLEVQLLRLDSLAGKGGMLERTWRGQQFLVSLHATGKGEFDFLFAIQYDDERVPALVKLLESHVASPGQPKSRMYSGVTLWEYQPELSPKTLTYGFYKNVLVASFTSFLAEDAIRTAKSEEHQDFKSMYPQLFTGKPSTNVGDLIRVPSKGLGMLIGGISPTVGSELASDMVNLGYGAILYPSYAEGTYSLLGTYVNLDGGQLGNQPVADPISTDVFNQVSNRTAVLRVVDTKGILAGTLPATRSLNVKSTVYSDVKGAFDQEVFFNGIFQQAVYMILDSPSPASLDRILLLPVKIPGQSFGMIRDFAQRILQQENSPEERDVHLGREIVGIGMEEFPLHLYNGVFEGFSRVYLVESDGFLVMANSLRVMKNYLDDLYNDNTWGKSLARERFADRFNGSLPFMQWVDVPRFYNQLINGTTPHWSAVFQKYASNFGALSLFTIQLGGGKSGDEIQMILDYGGEASPSAGPTALTLSSSVRFNFPLAFGPVPLQNFTDRSTEYLVQDDRNTIYLIGPEGNLVFSKEMDFPVLGDVFQIDFYKNGKLQLVFACEDGIYGFDRLGNALPGYPIPTPQGRRIAYFNLVDYEANEEYRYFVGDELGDLYLSDKNGNLLEGWNPKRTSGRLADKPSHYRILGVGDVMVSLHENGNLELMNRRGELKTGQPVRLGDGLATQYGLTDRGGASSQLVTVNTAGEVVSVNFNGELTYRSQLLRPDRETSFHVVNNQNRDDFLIVLHEFNKITVLNANESPLFEYPILSEKLVFQWFDFGYERDVFVAVDPEQEFAYLFDLRGNLLSAKPVEAAGPISVSYSALRSEYVITVIFNNQLREYKLPL